MSLTDTQPAVVIGNPVRRELLVRSLRSNRNAAILMVWAVVINGFGIGVLFDQVGFSRPFSPHQGSHEALGATLGQWWITSLVVGIMCVAVVFGATGCASHGERRRRLDWGTTLVSPWKVTVGVWTNQLALLLLSLSTALPVAAIAVALGGTSPSQLGVGLGGAFITGATVSAVTIAIACRANRVIGPLVVGFVFVAAILIGPWVIHQSRSMVEGDPVMAVTPLVGVADAAAPISRPHLRFGPNCAPVECGGLQWDTRDASTAPLLHLRDTVRPWNGRIPPWAWTTIGAVVVMVASLVITRFRILRR